MKDYVAVAGQLGVSHLIALSQTKSNVVMRIARFPSGPTMHFRVQQYTLQRLVRASQKRPYDSSKACKTHVLCSFGVVLRSLFCVCLRLCLYVRVVFFLLFPAMLDCNVCVRSNGTFGCVE